MDGEVRLPVGKIVVVVFSDNKTYRNINCISIICTSSTSRYRSICYFLTFCVFTDLITLTTEIEDFALLILGKGQRGDVGLIRLT